MSIRERVHQDMVAAMKARQDAEKGALRLLLAALTEAEKLEGKALSEDDEVKVVARKLKETNRSMQEYERLGQPQRVADLQQELAIFQRYAPQPMSHEALVKLVDETATQIGATSPQDMGKLMPAVMAKVGGKADGAEVRRLVQARLANP